VVREWLKGNQPLHHFLSTHSIVKIDVDSADVCPARYLDRNRTLLSHEPLEGSVLCGVGPTGITRLSSKGVVYAFRALGTDAFTLAHVASFVGLRALSTTGLGVSGCRRPTSK